mgnify:CR=1 FL=1
MPEEIKIVCRICNQPLMGFASHQGCVSQVKWGMGRRGIGRPLRLKEKILMEQRKRILGD